MYAAYETLNNEPSCITKQKKSSFRLKMTAWVPQKFAPNVFCKWLKATVSLKWDNRTFSTFQCTNSYHSTIFHRAKFYLHWYSNAISTKQSMSCCWLSEQRKKKHLTKAHTFNCMGLQICLKCTQICTGPRFTMHSSPMTELSISG